jgi:hypothetical protein
MKQIAIGRTLTAIAVTATVLAVAASWLVAGAAGPAPEPTSVPESAPATAETARTPLPDFLPSEKLPAGSSVAFPTDI